MAETIVGLDIGSSYLKAAQGRETSNGVEIEKVGSRKIEGGAVRDGAVIEDDMDLLSDAIEELWDETGFTSKEIIIGISGDRVLTNEVIVPYMSPDDLEESLIHQINEKSWLSLDIEKSEIDKVILEDFIDPEDDKRKLRIFLAGVPSQMIEDISVAAIDVGLKPVGVDLGALAALRSLRVVNRSLSDNTLDAIIDVGADLTTVIFHQGGVPLHIQTVSGTSGNAATKTMKEYVTETIQEAEEAKILGGTGTVAKVIEGSARNISRSIRSVVDYYFSARQNLYLGSITLIGGTSLLQGLQENLQNEFNSIPVIQGEYDPIYRMSGGAPISTHAPNGGTYFTAVGLITGTLV